MVISISETARRMIMDDCLTPDYKERVGLLAGCDQLIEQALPLRNQSDCIDAFFILQSDIEEARQRVEKAGLRILGRYHTHEAA